MRTLIELLELVMDSLIPLKEACICDTILGLKVTNKITGQEVYSLYTHIEENKPTTKGTIHTLYQIEFFADGGNYTSFWWKDYDMEPRVKFIEHLITKLKEKQNENGKINS